MKRIAFVALVALLLLPGAAEASCAPGKPKERLAAASAAFVGTVVEREEARITFAVEERYRGDLPDRVTVEGEGANTSIGLNPAVGDRLGLLLRAAGPDGVQRANACDVIAPDDLREAAAAGAGPCLAPTQIVAASRTSGRQVLLGVAVSDADGTLSRLTVRWGDGRTTVRRLAAGNDRRRVLRISHRYRRAGARRIRVSTLSAAGPGCGAGPERSVPARLRVRPKR